jgi:hypothetical protein
MAFNSSAGTKSGSSSGSSSNTSLSSSSGARSDIKVISLQPLFHLCEDLSGHSLVVIREIIVTTAALKSAEAFAGDRSQLLHPYGSMNQILPVKPPTKTIRLLMAVNSEDLSTRLLQEDYLHCLNSSTQDSNDHRWTDSLYFRTLQNSTTAPHFGMTKALESTAAKGVVLTGDLCPSSKSLDKSFFENLHMALTTGAKSPHGGLLTPIPLALAVSGKWLLSHHDDLLWLKDQEQKGYFQISWVNHSYSHPYSDKGASITDDFLLHAGVNLDDEILRAERLMISKGLVPSVFFRAPGLAMNEALAHKLKQLHLIPLGASAWVAKMAAHQKIKDGDVILIHLNGNEPLGVQRLTEWIKKDLVPMPIQPLLPRNAIPKN